MGFRIYMYSYPKEVIHRFEGCSTVEDVVNVCKDYGLGEEYEIEEDIEDGCAPAVYRYGNEIFEFGSDNTPFDDCIDKYKGCMFKSQELHDMYSENIFVKLTKEDFKNAIEWCAQQIRDGYADLMREESKDPFLADMSHLDRLKDHIHNKITEWDNSICSPYRLDPDVPVTGRWSYEFAIWELIRQYRIFDWDRNELCLSGW